MLHTAVNTKKKKEESLKKQELLVSEEAQQRLSEILADSPRIVSFNNTDWEIRPLRFGTQYLICQEVCKINKADGENYGDIVKQFITNIPAMANILTLILLNDKELIFNNGNENGGFSKLFKTTKKTIMWDMNVNEFLPILIECLQMIDVGFFLQSQDMLQIFKDNVTKKKRMMKKTQQVN